MKVAAVQMEPALADTKVNRKKIKQFVKEAGKRNADLIVLPELANSGYNLTKKEVKQTAETIPGKTTTMLVNLAKQYESVIVVGINEKKGGNYYNSAALLQPSGELTTYRKVHLFNKEKRFFTAGTQFQVVKTKHANIGVMICFDWFFPESTRILALKGAEVIAHPANLVLPYCQSAMPIRTLVNKVYAITANRIGEERDLAFTGNSQITNPSGETVESGSKEQEEILFADIEVSKAREKKINEYNHVLKDIGKETLKQLLQAYQKYRE